MIANCGTIMSLSWYGCVLWSVIMGATSTICTNVNAQGLLAIGYKDDDIALEMQESKGEEGSEGLQEYPVSEKTCSL